ETDQTATARAREVSREHSSWPTVETVPFPSPSKRALASWRRLSKISPLRWRQLPDRPKTSCLLCGSSPSKARATASALTVRERQNASTLGRSSRPTTRYGRVVRRDYFTSLMRSQGIYTIGVLLAQVAGSWCR
ncbi:unnamed protein product, partial [Ectocarpus fasciculatus]